MKPEELKQKIEKIMRDYNALDDSVKKVLKELNRYLKEEEESQRRLIKIIARLDKQLSEVAYL